MYDLQPPLIFVRLGVIMMICVRKKAAPRESWKDLTLSNSTYIVIKKIYIYFQAKESPTQNSDDTSNVISSTEETSEKASEKTSDAATIATNAETSSPVTAAETSSTEPNNEASTSE